jgi:SAM-dependent methyltransferase
VKDFWNQRYSETAYAYGTEPNEYFRVKLAERQPGRLYLPGDGEGRNAVHAAIRGWAVDAVDYSPAGREKALSLAAQRSVDISFTVADLATHLPPSGHYDAAALIFVHFPEVLRKTVHSRTVDALRPGGVLVVEAFAKGQLAYGTGGPKSPDLLYGIDELLADFPGTDILEAENLVADIHEGPYHDGPSDVIRLLLIKR